MRGAHAALRAFIERSRYHLSKDLPRPPDPSQPNPLQRVLARAQEALGGGATAAGQGGGAQRSVGTEHAAVPPTRSEGVSVDNPLGLSAAELARRRSIGERALASTPEARAALQRAESKRLLDVARANAERAQLEAAAERERRARRPRQAHYFDPGADPSQAPAAVRDRERAHQQRERELAAAVAGNETPEPMPPPRTRTRRKKLRPWKQARRKPAELSGRVLKFSRDHGWSPARAQALATRTKKNDAIIAHPRSAEAAYKQLPAWHQAAIRRALKALRWTFADEAARRHVALWATFEEFAYCVPFSRPRQYLRMNKGKPEKAFSGAPRFGRVVRGWTQSALVLALSGAACTDAGADPIAEKTIQRHVVIAEDYGGLRRVVRNPDAAPEFRGFPTESNPRGWSINEYWVPDVGFFKPDYAKPARDGAPVHFDAEGNPLELELSLALELVPRMKRARRLREQREQPPPIAS